MSAEIYYVLDNGDELGPFPKETLFSRVREGFFKPSLYCWKPGETERVKISSLRGCPVGLFGKNIRNLWLAWGCVLVVAVVSGLWLKFLGLPVYWSLAVLAYPLPILVSYRRGHPQLQAIAVLNVTGGWTVIGWIAALTWSAINFEEER